MAARTIIALVGHPKSGKGWVSARLTQNHGFEPVRFSAPISQLLVDGLGVPPDAMSGTEKGKPLDALCGLSPLQVMRAVGFECCRKRLHPDLLLVPWRRALDRAEGPVLVDDMRFPNEYAALREAGGVFWEIRRPGYCNERALQGITPDVTLHNDGSIGALLQRVDEALQA